MIITINKDSLKGQSLYLFLRKCGYAPHKNESFVKPLSRFEYPRFHIYIKEKNSNYILNLHLDMKKPIYDKIVAHSGQYHSDNIKVEAKRILNCIDK